MKEAVSMIFLKSIFGYEFNILRSLFIHIFGLILIKILLLLEHLETDTSITKYSHAYLSPPGTCA